MNIAPAYRLPAKPRANLSAGQCLVALLILLFQAGCSVLFVAPYDSVVDQSINDLHVRTIVFLDRMARTGGSFAENRSFYDEAHGTIATIRSRAAMLPKNEGTLNNLKELDDNITRLAVLHKIRPLTGTGTLDPAYNVRELIESNFRSLTRIELHKKLGSSVGKSADAKPAS